MNWFIIESGLEIKYIASVIVFYVFILLFFIVVEIISTHQRSMSSSLFSSLPFRWVGLCEYCCPVKYTWMWHVTSWMMCWCAFISPPLPAEPFRTPVPADIVPSWKQPRLLSHLLDKSHTGASSKLHQTLSIKFWIKLQIFQFVTISHYIPINIQVIPIWNNIKSDKQLKHNDKLMHISCIARLWNQAT